MGWYLRRCFRLGPLRLNLSKQGSGAPVGMKGARLGVDGTGKPSVAGGRGSLYFCKRLGGQTAGHDAHPPKPPGLDTPRDAPQPTWRTETIAVLLVIAVVAGFVPALVWVARDDESAKRPSPGSSRAGEVSRAEERSGCWGGLRRWTGA